MGKLLCILVVVFVSFRIGISIPQFDEYMPQGQGSYNNEVWDFFDIDDKEIPLTRRFESFEDGVPPPFPVSDVKCHQKHIHCQAKSVHRGRICAHSNKYGLVAFPSDCAIYLENCLIASYEARTGQKSIKERYYYNGKSRHCEYYIKQAYTIQDAIQLYYMFGRVKQTRRNEPPKIDTPAPTPRNLDKIVL